MKKTTMIQKLMWFVFVMLMTAGMLTGCSGKSAKLQEEQYASAVILGNHGNAKEIPLNAEALVKTMENVVHTCGKIAFVENDGDPEVYFLTQIPEPPVKGLDTVKIKEIEDGYLLQLQELLLSATPKEEEVDTLKAITLGAAAISDEPGKRVMVIADTGISTTSYLDFRKGLLALNEAEVVEALKNAEALPDLTGIDVIWIGMAESAFPQEELSASQKMKLKSIWRAILDASGAASVLIDDNPISGPAYADVPAVSTVQAEAEVLDIAPIDTVVLDETRLQFVGNKAVFVDAERAAEEVSDVAQTLLKNPRNKVYILGTTAGGTDDAFCRELSINRAAAVKDLMIASGVPAEQMILLGMGPADPFHIDDLDEDGNLIEERARQNRKVMIIDTLSPDAELL